MANELDDQLTQVFDAARVLRQAEEKFFTTGNEQGRMESLARSLEVAWTHTDENESVERLIRIGDMLGTLGGPEGCRLLVRLLDHEDPGVRSSAGEGLIDLGHSRYAEVAKAFEKAIEDGKALNALTEMPYLLAELGEPGGMKLCKQLLKHGEGDVVAAAIEALAALGDVTAIKDIERFKSDKRKVTVEEELETGELTVGELAQEALDHLRSLRD